MERNNADILNHQLEEWKYLNDYINRIDIGYQKSFATVIAIFTIVTALLSINNSQMQYAVVFVVPPGILVAFAFLSYQFRIVAIVRGRLSAIEKSMNSGLGENVHLLNSFLVDEYMAKKNLINRWMMAPFIFLVFVITAICVYFSCKWFSGSYMVILIIYWLIILVFAIVVLVPFLRNEIVRKEVDEVLRNKEKEEKLK